MVGYDCFVSWNHEDNLLNIVQECCEYACYVDCSLVAENCRLDVHQIVLSTASPLFKTLLLECKSEHPVITLEGFTAEELRTLVEYMYKGEVHIDSEVLIDFMRNTEILQISSLSNHMIEAVNNTDVPEIKVERLQSESQEFDESLDGADYNEIAVVNEEDAYNGDLVKSESVDYVDMTEYEEDGNACLLVEDGSQLSETEYLEFNEITNDGEIEQISGSPEPNDDSDNIEISNDCSERFNTDNESDETSPTVYINIESDDFDSLIFREGRITEKRPLNAVKKKLPQAMKSSVQEMLMKPAKSERLIGEQLNADNKKVYYCVKCGNKYSHKRTLLHHIHWICDQPATYTCSLCPYSGKRKFQLKSHMKHVHLMQKDSGVSKSSKKCDE